MFRNLKSIFNNSIYNVRTMSFLMFYLLQIQVHTLILVKILNQDHLLQQEVSKLCVVNCITAAFELHFTQPQCILTSQYSNANKHTHTHYNIQINFQLCYKLLQTSTTYSSQRQCASTQCTKVPKSQFLHHRS